MPTLPVNPDDTVRATADMAQSDRLGSEGRWLDVPRLPQFNGEIKSLLWCGRASAAMVYDFYCKVLGKTSEYVAHLTGDPGPGAHGKIKDNLRWSGGSHKGELAGLADDGKVYPAGIFKKAGWTPSEGYLQKSATEKISTDRAEVEKRFAPLLEQLAKNNPVVLYSRLSTGNSHGHVVVVSGFKRLQGELWLRITDPTQPQEGVLGDRNWALVQRKPDSFSEYWVRAGRLLEDHPEDKGKRLLSYMDDDRLGRYLFVADQKVADDSELIHPVGTGNDGPSKSKGGGQGKDASAGQAAAPKVPPAQGGTSLPYDRNGSQTIDAESLTALYHSSERGLGGFFPLGDTGAFHCGAHFATERNANVRAVAGGEVAAARLSGGPGTHPWGDTGFVLLRHRVKPGGAEKAIFSLHLHLDREALHPDRTRAGWLRRLLIAASSIEQGKPKWRVPQDTPTWKDEDKGKFSPTNVKLDQVVKAGVYEEQDRLVEDHGTYVKLSGGWIRASMQDGDAAAKELSPWADFDLDQAAKKSPAVAALRDGKVAVLDGDKDDKGARKWTVQPGEVIGAVGTYLNVHQMHWSVFSKDAVFPSGSLPKAEFGLKDEVKLKDLDVSSKDAGSLDLSKLLIEALEPDKKTLGKVPEGVVAPGEVRRFYRSPSESWRSRYLAVKGLADFKLEVDKLLSLERNKSHTEDEKKKFKENAKAFVFWDDLSSVEGFPGDGKAIFVHPASALRLMCGVALAADHDDAPPEAGEVGLHPHEDITLALRDSKGPLAAVEVIVRCEGAQVVKGKTDSQGLLLVPIDRVADKQIEIEVAASCVPDKARLTVAANDTAAPRTLQPGAPQQTFNGTDPLPQSRLGLRLKVKDGQAPGAYAEFNPRTHKESKKIRALKPGEVCEVERIVFHLDDGSAEVIQTHVDSRACYVWSIWKGEHNFEAEIDPPGKAGEKKESKDPVVLASWSAQKAHLNDHPVLSARVKNISDGTELTVTFFAMLVTGAEEHDEELHGQKVKVANAGFSVPFDPHQLAADHDLLGHPQPVFAKVKVGDKTLSLRDVALTVYDGPREQERPPPAPQKAPEGAKTIVAFTQIARTSPLDDKLYVDRYRTADDKEPQVRKLSQLSTELRGRFVQEGEEELYIGTVGGEMHLASEDLQNVSAAKAITAQREALQRLYPDAPLDRIFAKPEDAWFSDRGMTVGICAQDCPKGVNSRGKASGCTEQIRTKNLLACALVPAAKKKEGEKDLTDACRSAVKEPTKLPIVAGSCASYLNACHKVNHDKSKCFLQTVVRGPESEERARWYVSFPWVTEEWRKQPHNKRRWPYHGDNSGAAQGKQVTGVRNFRVLLLNPQNGNAVVCSGQDWGNHREEKYSNPKIDSAAVEKDEFKTKKLRRVFGLNPIVNWKLGFKNSDAQTVLFAFVPVGTPLGPVPEGTVIKLRKQATYLQIMGVENVPDQVEEQK
jgi:hypothetical protein